MADAIGLSVGAAKLAAVAIGRAAVTRSAVLTQFPHRPPEVGLPSENPELDERGLIISDFVDRVGDPVPIIASDGSPHVAAELLADALCSLLYAVTQGKAPVDPIGVAHPSHWRPPAIDALWRALAGLPEFCEPKPVLLVSDAVAALTALQDDPGVPTRGIVAVCDFGATGTSITFADAARGFAPVAPTARDTELSGDVVDQALLTHVVADLASAGSIDLSSTSAIGSLSRLRGQCRSAKERLSTSSVTSLAVELPGRRAEVRLTRNELDDAIEQPLADFVGVLHDALQRSGIRLGDLVAVASVGGGARIPVLTTTLSEHLRVPVITTGHPELSSAIGGGLKALHGSVDEGVTSMTPIAARTPQRQALEPARSVVPASSVAALAWSDSEHVSDPMPILDPDPADPRPRMQFGDHDHDYADEDPSAPWYRHPFALLAAGVGIVLTATAAAAVLVLVRDDSPAPISTPPTTSQTPTTTEVQPPQEQPASSNNVVPPPPPPSLTTVVEAPPAQVNQAPPPATPAEAPPGPSTDQSTTPPPPATPTSTEAPPPPSEQAPPPSEASTQAPPAQPPQIPAIPEIPAVPGLPPGIPQPGSLVTPP